jgi:membrane protein DedA with SNARE-associated domain
VDPVDNDQPEPAEAGGSQPEAGKPSRRTLWFLVTPLLVIWVGATIATALTPTLATKHPLLLIALDPRNRNLVLARHVDLVSFFIVGVFRRMLTDPLYYLLGRLYGDATIRWLERNAGGGQLVRWAEKAFAKASYLIVFLWPGPIVCALAGAAGMRVRAFVITNVAGTIAAVVVLRLSGDLLGGPVDAILGFFNRNLLVTTVATVLLVVLSLFLGRLDTEPSIKELEAEIEADETAEPATEE